MGKRILGKSGLKALSLGCIAAILSLSFTFLLHAADSPETPASDLKITRSGSQPSTKGPAEYFTGVVHIDPLFQANDPSRASGARVTFEPGARTAWHAHPVGQTLIVTAGVGWIQRWNGPIEEIRQGDVVWIPPGLKHWHGATATTSMTHIAIQEQVDGKAVKWMEKVSDEHYGKGVATVNREPTAAQKMIGDFAPELVDLTDRVLYGEVWERPELSKRDRSLVTVAALIALNRPDQLRSHLARALDNGVKREELIETITHLAFYSGWPTAMTAITIAKEVFSTKDSSK